MIADLIIDFDSHLKHGKMWLVELQLPLQDAPEDVPSCIDVDLYLAANNQHQAMYIAQCMYPDNVGCSCNDDPVTEEIYASRRNRSLS